MPFTLNLQSVGHDFETVYITQPITTVNFLGGADAQLFSVIFIQDGTGHAVTTNAGNVTLNAVPTAPHSITVQNFIYVVSKGWQLNEESGVGTGTVTEVDTAGIATGGPIITIGTVQVLGSGNTTTAATANANLAAATNNDVLIADGSGNVKDSGVLISSLSTTHGTVTNIATDGIATGGPITDTGTITVLGSGNTTTAATATTGVATAPSGDVVTTDGSGNVEDSGVLLSSLSTGGTVTNIATAGIATGGPITGTGTITVLGSGNTTTAATATTGIASAPTNDIITADGSGNVKDSGVLISSILPFDPIDPTISWWREEWAVIPAAVNTSPFGQMLWDVGNWGGGTPSASIGAGNGPSGSPNANYFRYINLVGDGSGGDGSRLTMRIQQELTQGNTWYCRVIFAIEDAIMVTDSRLVVGFATFGSTIPATWCIGARFDSVLGANFMVGIGPSDASSGTWTDTGVVADGAWHDLEIYSINDIHTINFVFDGGSPITITDGNASGFTHGYGMYPSLMIAAQATSGGLTNLDCNFFAMKYIGLTR